MSRSAERLPLAFRIANALMLPLFLLSAAVQFNDPDPAGWVLIYSAAAVLSGLAIASRLRWAPAVAVTVVAGAWAGAHASAMVGTFQFGELFTTWKMNDVRIEEARELLGLLVVMTWCAFDAAIVLVYRRRPATVPIAAPQA